MDYDEIVKILLEKKFNSENWVKNHYPDFHYFIYSYIIDDVSWWEKFYLYRNSIKERPLCYCGNNLKFIKGKYRTYCSIKCMSNSNKVKKKRSETNIERYGHEIPLKNEKIKNKIRLNLEKRGVTNVSQLPEVKNKVREINLRKYGVEYISQLDENREKLSKLMKENQDILQSGREYYIINSIKDKIIAYNLNFVRIKEPSLYEMFCWDCNNLFDIHKTMLNDRLELGNNLCTVCNPINSSSDMQNQLYDYIKSLYDGDIIVNTRSVISKELDIYLPDMKLAFEFNGIYWHSIEFKDRLYHFNKSKECEKNGITLIHIWENDWLDRTEYIKSKIKSLFTSYDDYHMRDNIDHSIISKFISDLYLNDVGYHKSIGVFYKDELVSLLLDDEIFLTKVNNTLHLFEIKNLKLNGDFLFESMELKRMEPDLKVVNGYEIYDSGYLIFT